MLHPVSAHFAVVLPIIALVLGIAYLIRPSELMSKISTRFMVFATIFLVVAYFTGKHDGSEAYPSLSSEGGKLLVQHKDFALYLLITMGIATVAKLIGCFKKIFKVEIFAVLVTAILVGGVLYQGKMGGELTYTYGANVAQHSDGMDCLQEQKEFNEDDE